MGVSCTLRIIAIFLLELGLCKSPQRDPSFNCDRVAAVIVAATQGNEKPPRETRKAATQGHRKPTRDERSGSVLYTSGKIDAAVRGAVVATSANIVRVPHDCRTLFDDAAGIWPSSAHCCPALQQAEHAGRNSMKADEIQVQRVCRLSAPVLPGNDLVFTKSRTAISRERHFLPLELRTLIRELSATATGGGSALFSHRLASRRTADRR